MQVVSARYSERLYVTVILGFSQFGLGLACVGEAVVWVWGRYPHYTHRIVLTRMA
jgi:hypothetical protein